MSPHTTDTTHEKASTATLPSGHAGRRRLIIALTVLAFLTIGAVALYAISLIVGAVILLLFSALLAYLIYPLVQFLTTPPPISSGNRRCLSPGSRCPGCGHVYRHLLAHSAIIRARAIYPIPLEPGWRAPASIGK